MVRAQGRSWPDRDAKNRFMSLGLDCASGELGARLGGQRRAWAAGEVDVQGVAHFDSDAEKDRLDIKLRS